ncbi:MAG TPA: hypothetical protein VMF03_02810 [Steroidobacteraceae bacterium]|nr:hypothetical protein [Steroidobacteraceae bacterium]
MAYNAAHEEHGQARNQMIAVLGWLIIVAAFVSFSMMLLWPVFRLVRRSHPGSKGFVLAWVAAAAACSIGLWFLIPVLVHNIFAKTVH